VTFEAGARTAWHTHPLGQRLLVVDWLEQVSDQQYRTIQEQQERRR
jgi:hypothetical protein